MGKVLVVEDDGLNMHMWVEALKFAGLSEEMIVCASSYPEALTQVEAHRGSIVMVATDIDLGGKKTGLDLISEVLPQLPAVVMSGRDYEDPAVRVPIEARRVRGVLTRFCHKPLRLDDFAATVLACFPEPIRASA